MKTTPVGIGIVGAGFARTTQIPGFRDCMGAKVVAIASRHRERAAEFTEGIDVKIQKIISADQLIEIQKFNHKIYTDQKIRDYVAQIVDATRHPADYDLDIDNKIEYGASPRASLWLTVGAKSNAILNGRGYVTPQDIQDIVYDVLRHRILLTYDAEAEYITSDQIIKTILEKIPVP